MLVSVEVATPSHLQGHPDGGCNSDYRRLRLATERAVDPYLVPSKDGRPLSQGPLQIPEEFRTHVGEELFVVPVVPPDNQSSPRLLGIGSRERVEDAVSCRNVGRREPLGSEGWDVGRLLEIREPDQPVFQYPSSGRDRLGRLQLLAGDPVVLEGQGSDGVLGLGKVKRSG